MVSPRFCAATSGSYHEAGLPNITGNIFQGSEVVSAINGTNARLWGDGAFTALTGSSGKYVISATNQASNLPDIVKLDASHSSSVYGNSDTVQPASFTTRYIIKY